MTQRDPVLVTGAAGVLGSAVAEALAAGGVSVRGLGRSAVPASFPGTWTRTDLLRANALDGIGDVRTVVHTATTPLAPKDDLLALDSVIAFARRHGCHLVYVGIAGIEDAASVSSYYDMKLAGERRVVASGVSHTIVRVTQFHPFVDFVFRSLTLGPALFVPRVRLQPIDVDFAAARIAELALVRTPGRVADLHGPQTLSGSELAAQRVLARGTRAVRLPAPPVGPLRGLGRLRIVAGESGGRTWHEWLAASPASGAYGR